MATYVTTEKAHGSKWQEHKQPLWEAVEPMMACCQDNDIRMKGPSDRCGRGSTTVIAWIGHRLLGNFLFVSPFQSTNDFIYIQCQYPVTSLPQTAPTNDSSGVTPLPTPPFLLTPSGLQACNVFSDATNTDTAEPERCHAIAGGNVCHDFPPSFHHAKRYRPLPSK